MTMYVQNTVTLSGKAGDAIVVPNHSCAEMTTGRKNCGFGKVRGRNAHPWNLGSM